jgi:subtilisin family serine protease
MRRWILFLFLVLLFFATPANGSVASPRVDPRVFSDTADGQTTSFLVLLKAQVDSRALAARAPNRQAQGRVVFDALRQTANSTQAPLRVQLDALGAKHRAYWIANVIAVEGNRAALDAMLARSDVLAIESDRAFRVQLEEIASRAPAAPRAIEWNVSKVRAPDVWSLGYTGQGRVYANADTGVQWNHPALKPQYRGWNGMSADHNYNWWDAIHSDISGNGTNVCGFSSPAPCGDYDHGTHTMGTGVGDDGAGNQIGVAPGAKWIACRNMDDGWGRPSTYIECMQFFVAPTDLSGSNPDPDKRPDAVGNSYTCPPAEGCAAHSLQLAMENVRSAGVFMSVSAGNSGSSCSSINEPPALEASAITIGATDSGDNIAAFSSRGPVTIDGGNRRKPDLVAPGVNVRSSVPTNSYGVRSGTSMASPHVAGAVVLLWSAYPSFARNVSGTQTVLEQSALHLTSAQGCGGDASTQVPNNVYGYGRLDVLAAYNYAAANPLPLQFFFPVILRDAGF